MLIITTADIEHTSRGLESDRVKTRQVIHAVEAKDTDDACRIVRTFYEQKSDSDPYGERYRVLDVEAFEQLSEASLVKIT